MAVSWWKFLPGHFRLNLKQHGNILLRFSGRCADWINYINKEERVTGGNYKATGGWVDALLWCCLATVLQIRRMVVMQQKYDWLEMTSSLSVSRRLVLVAKCMRTVRKGLDVIRLSIRTHTQQGVSAKQQDSLRCSINNWHICSIYKYPGPFPGTWILETGICC